MTSEGFKWMLFMLTSFQLVSTTNQYSGGGSANPYDLQSELYLGCWKDVDDPGLRLSNSSSVHPNRAFYLEQARRPDRTIDNCISECRERNVGHEYAGLQNGFKCFCGRQGSSRRFQEYGRGTSCNKPCMGNRTQVCGGYLQNSVYQLCPDNCHNPSSCTADAKCKLCKNGYWGERCTKECPEHCKSHCDFHVGQCTGFEVEPRNLAVIKSASVKLRSKANVVHPSMTWHRRRHSEMEFTAMTDQGLNLLPTFVDEGYVLNKTNQVFNLEFVARSMDYAGVYRVDVSQTIRRYAQLTVLDSAPTCTVNDTGPFLPGQKPNEAVMYTCEVAYRGGLEPQMEWFGPNGTAAGSIEGVIDQSVPGELAKTIIIVRLNPTGWVVPSTVQGWTHEARIYFNVPDNPGAGYARNAPDFVYSYKSPPLVVHWLRSCTVTGSRYLQVGDYLTCGADANPPATHYEWLWMDNVIQEGSLACHLHMLEQWAGMDISLQCLVRNGIGDGHYSCGDTVDVVVVSRPAEGQSSDKHVPLGHSKPSSQSPLQSEMIGPEGDSPQNIPPSENDSGKKVDNQMTWRMIGQIAGIVIGAMILIVEIILIAWLLKQKNSYDDKQPLTE